jgi:PAS domain S-box-containing protein
MSVQSIRGAVARLAELRRELAGLEESLGLRSPMAPGLPSDPLSLAAYRIVADHAGEILTVLSLTGEYLYASPACERLVAWPSAVLVGRNLYEHVHPDDVPELVLGPAALAGGALAPKRFRFLCGDGRYRWLRGWAESKRGADGRATHLVATARPCPCPGADPLAAETDWDDVSVRAPEPSSDALGAALSRRSEPALVQRGGRILFANPSAAALLGWEAAELRGMALVEVVHPEDRLAAAERLRQLWGSMTPPDPVEMRLLGKGRDEHHVEMTGMCTVFDGQPAVLLMGRDVTETRKLEAQLLLADRLASLGVLSAGVAHEINNPLVYVLGNLELIVGQLEEKVAELEVEEGSAATEDLADSRQLASAASQALKGARRIEAIVSDLGEFARPPAECPSAVDPVDSLSFALRMSRRSITRHARLSVNLSPLPRVRGDESRLGQVFLNLLVNAADAIPDGAPMDRHRVAVRTYTDEQGWAVVEVADTGRGVREEDLPHLFDPFFTTKPVGKGMGLGLSICHGIVTALGGAIRVESQPGKGSRFQVLLPPSHATDTHRVITVPRIPIAPALLRRSRRDSSVGC